MADLIKRQDAIDAINCNIVITGKRNSEVVALTIGMFVDRIKALPSIRSKTGRWIWSYPNAYAECDQCHKVIFNGQKMNFCPICGADMRAEEEHEKGGTEWLI